MTDYYCKNEHGNKTKCCGYKKGKCISFENCDYKEDLVLSNGMTRYIYEKPKKSKQYLVQIHIPDENYTKDEFKILKFDLNINKWESYDPIVYAWTELPKPKQF